MEITIPVDTDADLSTVLELAIAAGKNLVEELETYDEPAKVDEDEVSVQEMRT